MILPIAIFIFHLLLFFPFLSCDQDIPTLVSTTTCQWEWEEHRWEVRRKVVTFLSTFHRRQRVMNRSLTKKKMKSRCWKNVLPRFEQRAQGHRRPIFEHLRHPLIQDTFDTLPAIGPKRIKLRLLVRVQIAQGIDIIMHKK